MVDGVMDPHSKAVFPLENFVSEVMAVSGPTSHPSHRRRAWRGGAWNPGWLSKVGRALNKVGHRSKGGGNTARSEHEKVWRYRSLASSQTPLHGWSDK